MTKVVLDDTDHALLALLRENARAPTAELARKLKLSRTTVQSRMERLQRQRVIESQQRRMVGDQPGALLLGACNPDHVTAFDLCYLARDGTCRSGCSRHASGICRGNECGRPIPVPSRRTE